ncbi:MAG: 50S ribosomal protein L3 [Candidatus Dojkabacteria bacterium]
MKAILGKKIGMTQIYNEKGLAIPATVLDVSNNVIAKKIMKGETVSHIELGKDKQKKGNKSDLGNYKTLGFVPTYKSVFTVKEIAAQNLDSLEEGAEIDLSAFTEGEKIDVSGINKGKGWQGVVKRWKFAGMPRTHGSSDRERAPGSLGTRTIPGRIFKGKKMGGHMGTRSKTIKNLKIALVDAENKLIAVSGSIPGAKGSYLVIKTK